MQIVATIIASVLSLALVVFIVWQLFALGKDLKKRRELKIQKLSTTDEVEKKGEDK